MKLYAPNEYWTADKDKLSICNGCGSRDSGYVPDTMWGLNISEACNIHDWMFETGVTLADFYFSNAVFIMNLALIIVNKGSKWLAPLRLARATKYFIAVQQLGEGYYWCNTNANKDMNITYKGSFKEV